MVNYAQNVDAAESVVAEIQSIGGQALAVQGDVGRADDGRRLVDAALQQYAPKPHIINPLDKIERGDSHERYKQRTRYTSL